jgi:glyoxylase-like metal-dependent hydrolase (beta-lactamase superfamily II)
MRTQMALSPKHSVSSFRSRLSSLFLAAGLLGACGSSTSLPADQAVNAAGGKDALLAANSQSVVASGQRFDNTQTRKAGDPAFQITGDFSYTLTHDVKGDRTRVAWLRPSLFAGPLMYSEIVDRDVGCFDGIDSAFTMMPQTPMQSARVAAVRKHVRLFNPHLLLRRAAEQPESVTVKEDASFNGAAHTVLELADAFKPIRLFVRKDSGLVAKVETLEDDPLRGDVSIEVAFEDYRAVSGLQIPHKATLSQSGVVLHKEVRSSVTINEAVSDSLFAIPAAATSTPNPQDAQRGEAISEYLHRYAAIGVSIDFDQSLSVKTDMLAQGVYLINGANAHTLAIELPTQVVAAEAPLDDARSRVVIAEIKRLIPGKPIRYVINTHHHDDHSGGLRTYVAEGATVVTGAQNEAFYKTIFAAPHRARPDALEQKPTPARIQAVSSTPFEITEGARKVRVLPLATTHADGMLMVYVEDVQLVLVADLFSPGFFPTNMPIQGGFAAGAKELYMALMSSGLAVQSIAGVHGFGTATMATLRVNAGF